MTVFDTSFKGTVRELLSAVYPETAFTRRRVRSGSVLAVLSSRANTAIRYSWKA